MEEKTFSQDSKGSRLESVLKTLSTDSGIYGVYRCACDRDANTVSLKQLIYIGNAADLNDRHNNHEEFYNWEKY